MAWHALRGGCMAARQNKSAPAKPQLLCETLEPTTMQTTIQKGNGPLSLSHDSAIAPCFLVTLKSHQLTTSIGSLTSKSAISRLASSIQDGWTGILEIDWRNWRAKNGVLYLLVTAL
ncbi:hypothetical protein VFPPC_18089 [Pochonia chlamydosporia 170]|uniref:Uncharacterized protein n=1 Tax=Pochonia chlamydosporia 170 TaxID=1380566 RepID=A0A219APC0_METCM|nr:hypothetical protein VFPPC_18089 [Pochonia chlamydosporia 170]OWT42676.1 hypothetical protein VFPPC_18089 [Pochonia chlamydosporia 170]